MTLGKEIKQLKRLKKKVFKNLALWKRPLIKTEKPPYTLWNDKGGSKDA